MAYGFTVFLFFVLTLGACAPPSGTPPDYERVFSDKRIQAWELSLDGDDWLALLTMPDAYVPVDLWVDGEGIQDVGLRFMGDPLDRKPSMRIRFNAFRPELTYHGLKRVNLRSTGNDPSQVREVAASALLRRAGLLAPRASLVEVWLDGEGPGLYSLVEQVDRKFLEDRFGENDGQLIKLETGGMLLDPGEQLDELVYEFKGDDVEPDTEGFLAFLHVLNRTPDEAIEDLLPAWVDVEACLKLWAVLAWAVHLDSYLGTGDNLYLYRDESGVQRPIPWDLNRAFANYHGTSCGMSTDDMLGMDPGEPTCGGPRPLVDRLLAVPAWRARYEALLLDLIDGPLGLAGVERELVRWHELAQASAFRDALSDYSPEQFMQALEQDTPLGDNPRRVPGLLPFVRARDAWIRQVLSVGD
ncbi:MAG: CotH kinase family protein [Deltaproteobacteria bacterium]|nr:CotH kinase family protein [Deltaproteobacteria bacterium]